MSFEIKAIIVGIALTLLGLSAWGVKHAVDVWQATAIENAQLKVSNQELQTSLNEEQREKGILFEVARSNTGVKNDIANSTNSIRGAIREAAKDPATRSWADTPVPVGIIARLSGQFTPTSDSAAMQGGGAVSDRNTKNSGAVSH